MLSHAQRHLAGLSLPPQPPAGRFCTVTGTVDGFYAGHGAAIAAAVARDGWFLLRGGAGTPDELAACMRELGMQPITHYGDLAPIAGLAQDAAPMFQVTAVPAREAILFHHEGAHTAHPCQWIAFQCQQAALAGGHTPLVDGGALWGRLPPELRSAFSERDLVYERRFIPGLDVPWQAFFGTEDPGRVRALCALDETEVSFHADEVRTRTRRPAMVLHPQHGVPIFFNQILLHHEACLDPEVRESLAFALEGAQLPRAVRFADGGPIPASWIAILADLYAELAQGFVWQDGDIVVIDNFRFAHARSAYTGTRLHRAMLGAPPSCSTKETEP